MTGSLVALSIAAAGVRQGQGQGHEQSQKGQAGSRSTQYPDVMFFSDLCVPTLSGLF